MLEVAGLLESQVGVGRSALATPLERMRPPPGRAMVRALKLRLTEFLNVAGGVGRWIVVSVRTVTVAAELRVGLTKRATVPISRLEMLIAYPHSWTLRRTCRRGCCVRHRHPAGHEVFSGPPGIRARRSGRPTAGREPSGQLRSRWSPCAVTTSNPTSRLTGGRPVARPQPVAESKEPFDNAGYEPAGCVF